MQDAKCWKFETFMAIRLDFINYFTTVYTYYIFIFQKMLRLEKQYGAKMSFSTKFS